MIASFKAEVTNDILGDRNSSTVVSETAIALLPRSVKVFFAERKLNAPISLGIVVLLLTSLLPAYGKGGNSNAFISVDRRWKTFSSLQ